MAVPVFLYPKSDCNSLTKRILKFLALVGMKCFWRAEHREHAFDQMANNSARRFIFDGYQNDKSSEMVDDRKDEAISL